MVLKTGKKVKVQEGFDPATKEAYVNGKIYTQEAIQKVKEAIR